MHPDIKLRKKLRDLMNTTLLDTQVRVAQASGVAQSSINRILNENQSPTLEMMAKLAEAFNLEAAEFMLLSEREAELLSNYRFMSDSEQRRLNAVVKAVSQNSDKRKKPANAVNPENNETYVDHIKPRKVSKLRPSDVQTDTVTEEIDTRKPAAMQTTRSKSKSVNH